MENEEATFRDGFPFVRYTQVSYAEPEMVKRSEEFLAWYRQRRSVRDFSNRPVPRSVIENILLAAGSAPSGANKQPWLFCAVSAPDLKKRIRIAAEKEEYDSYHGRMPDQWLNDLRPLGTDWKKPFLETAPWLIIVFRKSYDLSPDGAKNANYYVNESVGLACGFLLTALHHAGLVALTHTPSPMNFLSEILERPSNEKPFLLIPVGYPAEPTYVPDISKKGLDEISRFFS